MLITILVNLLILYDHVIIVMAYHAYRHSTSSTSLRRHV